MRDDISMLPIPASAKRYARMTSKEAFAPGKAPNANKKTELYIDQAADTTNQQDRKNGFKNKDATGRVQHSMHMSKKVGEAVTDPPSTQPGAENYDSSAKGIRTRYTVGGSFPVEETYESVLEQVEHFKEALDRFASLLSNDQRPAHYAQLNHWLMSMSMRVADRVERMESTPQRARELLCKLLEVGQSAQSSVIQDMSEIISQINKIKTEMQYIDWTDEEIEDEASGQHYEEMLEHLRNAIGRGTSLVSALKRVNTLAPAGKDAALAQVRPTPTGGEIA